MEILAVGTETHGRVLVERRATAGEPDRWLIVFHGYGQSADDVLQEAMKMPGIDRWHVAAPQALSRFYTRRDERVVASWMTRQDREQTILDNVAYVDRTVDALAGVADGVVFMGFSQGASMAYRAAMMGRREATAVVAVCGDVPPELKEPSREGSRGTAPGRPWPPVLIGVGEADEWYTPARGDEDARVLRARQVAVEVVRFSGGHEWTDGFRQVAGAWLAGLV